MRPWGLTLAVVGLLALHQDIWYWTTARPLVWGFLPVGLFYHALYTLLVAGVMMVLVRYAWPSEIERQAEAGEDDREGRGW